MSNLSEREKAARQRLKNDFPHYAEKCLKIPRLRTPNRREATSRKSSIGMQEQEYVARR